MSAGSDFDLPATLVEPEVDAFAGPAVDDVADTVQRPPREKALRLLGSKERYKDSEVQRAAVLAYATIAQADATDRNTDALTRLVEAAERQASATERLVAEQRINNQLLFFSMSESDFASRPPAAIEDDYTGDALRPDSLYTQMKRNVGILAAPRSIEVEPASDF